jgi:hypothetical protein
MLLCRISKVDELLSEKIVERALDTKSPFNAAGGPALLYPDLVKLYAAHAATIKAGLGRTQQTARFPWYDPSAGCMYLTACTSFLSGHSNAHAARRQGQLRTLTQQSGRPSALRLAGQERASRQERCRRNEVIELRPGFERQ